MKILLSFFLLLSSIAHAAEIKESFIFHRIKLNELARIVYGESLGDKYILDHDLLTDDRLISLDLRDIGKKQLRAAFTKSLEQYGYRAQQSGEIMFVSKSSEAEQKPETDLFVYRPKYRAAGYLTDLIGNVTGGHFTFQRQVKADPLQRQQSISPPQALQQPNMAQQAPIDTGKTATSTIDREMDVLVYEGTKKDISKLEKLLAQLDRPAGEVLVKGVVYEVTKSSKEGSAVGIALNLLSGRIGISGGITKNLGNALAIKAGGIDAIYSAFSTDSRFKQISSPTLRVSSGRTAKFSAGSDVPVLGAVQVDRNGNPVQSVEYKPSGVILQITPQVRDERIDLTVTQELSGFTATTTGVNNSPTLNKRSITTSIGAENDETIVLGGLDEEKAGQDHNGLPFLPKWLHSSGQDESKTEILLVLQVQKI